MKLKTALLAGVVMASAFSSASALNVDTGNNAQPNQSNLVFNPCDAGVVGSGNPVSGCLNDHHDVFVTLSSNESLEISGGQATLDSTDGTFSRLTIALNPLTAVILNIDATVNGIVIFVDGAGTPVLRSLDANGQNFFTITGITGNFLSFVTASQGVESQIVEDVKQIRLVSQVAAIPEPEAYALVLAGLAAIGFIAGRRRMRR